MSVINDEWIEERAPLLSEEKNPNDFKKEDCAQVRRKCCKRITVEPVILLYFMAYSPMVSLTQQYIYGKVAADNHYVPPQNGKNQCHVNTSSEEYKLEQHVQVISSHWAIFLMTAGVVPAIATTIFLGSYSDKAGRKPIILLPIFGGAIRSFAGMLVANYNLNLGFLFIGVIVEGLTGSICAEIMVCFAYIADVTTHKQRAIGILVLELCIGIGTFAASIGMGYLIRDFGFVWPFLFGLSMHFINAIYITLFIEETIEPQENIRFFDWDNYRRIWRLVSSDVEKRRWRLLMGLVILGLGCMAELGTIDINTLYLMDTPLCFDSVDLGYLSAASFTVRSFGALIAVLLFLRFIGPLGLMIVGSLSLGLYQLMYAVAQDKIYLYIGIVLGLGSTLVIPMVRTYNSKLVRADEQGTLFAAVAGIQLITVLVGTVIFTSLYSVTVTIFHGCVYYVICVVTLITAGLSIWLLRRHRREVNEKDQQLKNPVITSETA